MKLDYRDMLKEVEDLTMIEGFVAACLEMKENMLFYDRDLVLSAYSSTLEFWLVATLIYATLESDQLFDELGDYLAESLNVFAKELMSGVLPLDIQYLALHYLNGPGWAVQQRFPVYVRAIDAYRLNRYDNNTSIDELLVEVQKYIKRAQWKQAERMMGFVGERILRGDRLRPLWFKIVHPQLRLWLSGWQTITNNFSVAPYFNFPLEDIYTERQKRVRNNVVVDLAAFRNARWDVGGFTDHRIIVSPESSDPILRKLLEGDISADFALDDQAKKELEPILLAVVESITVIDEPPLEYARRAIEVLISWESKRLIPIIIEIMESLEPWDSLFQYCVVVLRRLGLKVLPAIRKYVRRNPLGPMHILFAYLIASGRKSKRALSLLLEMFDMAEWGNGKEVIGGALAHYAPQETETLLQQALAQLKDEEQDYYRKYMQNVRLWDEI